jgi:Outer membrane protein beta-barrel domain
VIRRFLALVLFFNFTQVVIAQEDCAIVLDNARAEFDAGRIENVPGILANCLDKNNFSDEQKPEVFKLLTITYLYLEDPDSAALNFLKLLEEQPEFRPSPSDPIELEYLSKQYITTPIFSFYSKAGANASIINVLNYNKLDSDNNPNPSYNVAPGFILQGGTEVHLNKEIGFNVEIELSSRSTTRTGTFLTNAEQEDLEQRRFNLHGSLPVYIRYTKSGDKYYPFVYVGYSPSYTLVSNVRGTRDPRREAKAVGNANDNLNSTTRFSQSLIFGIGLKRRFNLNYVTVDLRYRLGLTNMNNQVNQYDFTNQDNKSKVFGFAMLDDDLRWNGLELTIGYVWPQYDARKKDSKTLQTIVSGWFTKKEKGNE